MVMEREYGPWGIFIELEARIHVGLSEKQQCSVCGLSSQASMGHRALELWGPKATGCG